MEPSAVDSGAVDETEAMADVPQATPGPAVSTGKRPRSTKADAAWKNVYEMRVAIEKTEEKINGLEAKPKLAKREQTQLDAAKQKLDGFREKLVQLQLAAEAARAKEIQKAREQRQKAEQKAVDDDARRALPEAAVLTFIEMRLVAQPQMDNTSDKNANVWDAVVHNYNTACRAGQNGLTETDVRMKSTLKNKFDHEHNHYKAWLSVAAKAMQSGVAADEVLDKVDKYRRPSTCALQ